MSEYSKTVGGKLQLKGGLDLSLKKKKKKKRKAERDEDGNEIKEDHLEEFQLVKLQGSGRIHTSGTTVMGKMGTRFSHELSIGDALIILHPTSLKEETRIVTMVLSDVSISISSPFSSDLISTTTFSYIKAPPEEVDKDELEVCSQVVIDLTL
ncbi:hypothetical protein AC1031_018758 [Aphanomyces cochlioides]|nr:hypothetical protein AC1031_018758 [Aphanomyces cochlioides]